MANIALSSYDGVPTIRLLSQYQYFPAVFSWCRLQLLLTVFIVNTCAFFFVFFSRLPLVYCVRVFCDLQALLTLLISNNFAEIKGSVFKKFDKQNLFQLSCHDVVERFKLALFLAMIVLLNVCQGGLDDPVSQVRFFASRDGNHGTSIHLVGRVIFDRCSHDPVCSCCCCGFCCLILFST